MSVGRRKVRLDESGSWIFNRMADVYQARPAYPSDLVAAVADLARTAGDQVGDLGAGIGHFAVPLAQRGFDVVAIDPARAMLDELERSATERGVRLRTLHATAEDLPLDAHALDLALIADALHFMDKELVAAELRRVLRPRAGLAIVTSEFGATPFMRAVTAVMEDAAPRRPRSVSDSIVQLSKLLDVRLEPPRVFRDETPVGPEELEAILRSISFIGPAMNTERFAAFRARIHALPDSPVWARSFTLHAGFRRRLRPT
jgi:ubiquinone/menaquinone biosynthesis C-methylase UbiE